MKLLCFAVAIVTAFMVFSPQPTTQTMYCNYINGSVNGTTDPSMPSLPDQYSTTIEANIVGLQKTITAYEYFDGPGDRANLQMLDDGVLHDLIFDYANDQLFYVSGGICNITNLTTDDNNVLFGNIMVKGLPHVYTTAGALHFSAKFGEEYMGRDTIRGIDCDWWRSCLYWPELDSNFTLDYYFTVGSWDDTFQVPQVPVRALATGVRTKHGLTFNFTHYYDYIDFKPTLPKDLSVFETPNGIVCNGRVKTRPVPKLPRFYHYREEIIISGRGNVYQADIWYDQEYRYVRYDYRTEEKEEPLFTTNPISEIHDYNSGVRYVIDRTSRECVAVSISNASFDVSENTTITSGNGTNAYVIHMKNPMQLFYLDNSYAYTGQRMARGLLCDVFTANIHGYEVAGKGRKTATFEYYFLADGLKELPDDGSTSPGDVPVYLEVTVPDIGYRVTYNFVDFDEEHPDLSIWDISDCFGESSKLHFSVRFPGSYSPGSSGALKTMAQTTFVTTMNVAAIRVQDLRLDYDNSQVYISATLLDRSPYMAQFTFLSNKAIEMSDDAVYPVSKVANFTQCAQYCVQTTEFTCNSYDFCPLDTTGICRLSKAHIGDGSAVLTNNNTCDHYSRTVNGPRTQELGIAAAYQQLEQAVYAGTVSLDQYILGQHDPIKLVAVDVKVDFGWLKPVEVPSLSGQFSYHLEITVPETKGVYSSHIFYDSDYKLVRYDMVNTQPSPPYFTVDPLSTIHDYNSGLSYVMDKAQGNCTIHPITNTSFDVTSSVKNGFVLKMKSPLDLFYLNGSYQYAGQRTTRGILCDVFEDRRTDFRFGKDALPQPAVFQFYFMSNNWQELSEDSGTEVKSQPIALIVSSAKGHYTLTYNFYDFSEQHPDLSNFDIRQCFNGNQQRHFLIKFQGNYHPILDTELKQFIKSVQYKMSFMTGASYLRFQDPQVLYEDGFVYYLATMTEQAPYLLDFTVIMNSAGIYPPDQILNNINDDISCAALCRKAKIPCEAFDYCPSTKTCILSQQHESSNLPGHVPSQPCNHYSRMSHGMMYGEIASSAVVGSDDETVDTIAPVEPTVDEAFVILKNNVYVKGFLVPVHSSLDGSNVVFNATLFDTDIIRPDTTSTTSPNLKHFIPSRERVMIPQVEIQFRGLSVDQCASRCLSEASIDCQAFDYCFDTGMCILSSLHPDRNLSVIVTNARCDLYARTYLDSYDMYPGKTTVTTAYETVTAVSSADLCARMCFNSKGFVCKSFDYCSSNQNCLLKNVHILDIPKSSVKSSAMCSHYSRKYIDDFDVSKMKTIVTTQQRVFTNVSEAGCAKLCAEGGATCQAFVFCLGTQKCTIVSVSPAQNRDKIKGNTDCNLYTRNYFGSTAANTSPQQQKQQSDKSSGYSGGAMAGLALGMLIPGMVLGAGLLYFLRTKRLVQEEQMRMGFVNMEHDADDNYDNTRVRPVVDDDMPPAHAHEYDAPSD